MHNVLIIFYIAFPIGNLFILPESLMRRRGFSCGDGAYRTGRKAAGHSVRDLNPVFQAGQTNSSVQSKPSSSSSTETFVG